MARYVAPSRSSRHRHSCRNMSMSTGRHHKRRWGFQSRKDFVSARPQHCRWTQHHRFHQRAFAPATRQNSCCWPHHLRRRMTRATDHPPALRSLSRLHTARQWAPFFAMCHSHSHTGHPSIYQPCNRPLFCSCCMSMSMVRHPVRRQPCQPCTNHPAVLR